MPRGVSSTLEAVTATLTALDMEWCHNVLKATSTSPSRMRAELLSS